MPTITSSLLKKLFDDILDDPKKALKQLDTLLQDWPEHLSLLEYRSFAFVRLHQWDKAAQALKAKIAAWGKISLTEHNKPGFYYDQYILMRLLATDCNDAKGAIEIGQTLLRALNNHPETYLQPNDVELFYTVYADALVEVGHPIEAAQCYEQIIACDLSDSYKANSLFRLAELETTLPAKQQRWQTAKHVLHNALLFKQRYDAEVWVNLACVHSLLGETTSGLEAAAIALSLHQKWKQNLLSDPDCQNLRANPLFEKIINAPQNPYAICFTQAWDTKSALEQYWQHGLDQAEATEKPWYSLMQKRFNLAKELYDRVDFSRYDDNPAPVLKILTDCEWTPNSIISDPENSTASPAPLLEIAVWRKRSKIVKALLEHKADPNIQHGRILSMLVGNNFKSKRLIKMLIKYGADINRVKQLKSAGVMYADALLFHALRSSNITMVECLIDHNVNVDIVSYDGKTPVEVALEQGMYTFAQIMHDRSSNQDPAVAKKIATYAEQKNNFIEKIYHGYYATTNQSHPDHYSGDPAIEHYYSGQHFFSCPNPPIHIATVTLTAFADFPEIVRRWKTYDVIFANCEDCSSVISLDQYVLERQADQRWATVLPTIDVVEDCTTASLSTPKQQAELNFVSDTAVKNNNVVMTIGGEPDWAQNSQWPTCDQCQQKGFYIGFCNTSNLPPDAAGGDDYLYLFLCTNCGRELIVRQIT